MKKILTVFGTRPEAIKMAPLVLKLNSDESIENRTCVTGQHREMLDQVLEIFKIVPEYDLNMMKSGQDLYDITSLILSGLKNIFKCYKPDLVLVHGDTTTTFAAALAAFYEKIPVGHVEAGLRTGDKYSPWPEEANRCLTSVLAQYHFAPTLYAKNQLENENIAPANIEVTGNTVVDSLFMVLGKIQSDVRRKHELSVKFPQICSEKKTILVTAHRRESFGSSLNEICIGLKKISKRFANAEIIFPVHLNPHVRNAVLTSLNNIQNIHLLDPLTYEDFVYLMNNVHIILTDSGGIQEEAPALGKPVLVMRDKTERPEALTAGTIRLVGTNPQNILSNVSELMTNTFSYKEMSSANNPYGDGTAADRILKFIKKKI